MVKESEVVRIREILEQYPKGLTIEDVSQKLGLNRGTAAKYLNLLVVSGQAEMRSLGPAKLFSLSHRVPLSQMLSFSSDLIMILDDDLFIQQVNDALLRFFKLERETIIGTQLTHSPLAQHMTSHHLEIIAEAMEGEEKELEEDIDIGGKPRTFRMKLLPLVFDQGNKGLGIIFEETSRWKDYQQDLEGRIKEPPEELIIANKELEEKLQEHKKIEKALQESEEKYRTLVENMRDVIFTLNDHGTITYISPVIRQVTAYEPMELLGRQLQDFIFKDDIMSFIKGMEHGRSGTTEPFEFRILGKDGSPRWVQTSGRALYRNEVMSGYHGILMNIQERKRSEDALRRAAKQIILLNSITRHDVLNGLTKLLGYLGVARAQTKNKKITEIFDRQQEVIKTIQQQISFTRDYQNIGLQPPRWTNVAESIRAAASSVDLGKISLKSDISNIEIFADDLIEKVFSNLITNSIEHGGHVSAIRFSGEKRKRALVIVCEDDGIGIPQGKKELIFEHTRSGRISYGLFFSQEVLAITGLTIQETGTEGIGARFEILVPEGAYRTL